VLFKKDEKFKVTYDGKEVIATIREFEKHLPQDEDQAKLVTKFPKIYLKKSFIAMINKFVLLNNNTTFRFRKTMEYGYMSLFRNEYESNDLITLNQKKEYYDDITIMTEDYVTETKILTPDVSSTRYRAEMVTILKHIYTEDKYNGYDNLLFNNINLSEEIGDYTTWRSSNASLLVANNDINGDNNLSLMNRTSTNIAPDPTPPTQFPFPNFIHEMVPQNQSSQNPNNYIYSPSQNPTYNNQPNIVIPETPDIYYNPNPYPSQNPTYNNQPNIMTPQTPAPNPSNSNYDPYPGIFDTQVDPYEDSNPSEDSRSNNRAAISPEVFKLFTINNDQPNSSEIDETSITDYIYQTDCSNIIRNIDNNIKKSDEYTVIQYNWDNFKYFLSFLFNRHILKHNYAKSKFYNDPIIIYHRILFRRVHKF
jgi:hypothetical protein